MDLQYFIIVHQIMEFIFDSVSLVSTRCPNDQRSTAVWKIPNPLKMRSNAKGIISRMNIKLLFSLLSQVTFREIIYHAEHSL